MKRETDSPAGQVATFEHVDHLEMLITLIGRRSVSHLPALTWNAKRFSGQLPIANLSRRAVDCQLQS